jgi:hypothetical protein
MKREIILPDGELIMNKIYIRYDHRLLVLYIRLEGNRGSRLPAGSILFMEFRVQGQSYNAWMLANLQLKKLLAQNDHQTIFKPVENKLVLCHFRLVSSVYAL